MTITLTRPIEHDGKTYTSVDLAEPTLGGLGAYEEARAAGKGHHNGVAALIAHEMGWSVAAAQRLCHTDAVAIGKVLDPFFSDETSGGGGAPPSPKPPTSSDGPEPN